MPTLPEVRLRLTEGLSSLSACLLKPDSVSLTGSTEAVPVLISGAAFKVVSAGAEEQLAIHTNTV